MSFQSFFSYLFCFLGKHVTVMHLEHGSTLIHLMVENTVDEISQKNKLSQLRLQKVFDLCLVHIFAFVSVCTRMLPLLILVLYVVSCVSFPFLFHFFKYLSARR